MDPILQQILDLLEQAPLTQTGKQDIRHTIRTEYYTAPEPVTLDEPIRRVRLAHAEDPDDCPNDCPLTHRHATGLGIISCIECPCTYSPREPIKQRVNLLDG